MLDPFVFPLFKTPMFIHLNHGPLQRLPIGKKQLGATRALWQTSRRIGALRGVSLRYEVGDVLKEQCEGFAFFVSVLPGWFSVFFLQ